jgi:hypothetical protein
MGERANLSEGNIMSAQEDPKNLEIETLSDDDLDSASGGLLADNTGTGTCVFNTGTGTCKPEE